MDLRVQNTTSAKDLARENCVFEYATVRHDAKNIAHLFMQEYYRNQCGKIS